MVLIEYKIGLNGTETVDKVADSIRFLRNFEPRNGEGYYLAFSGGKDSCVVKALCDMAGVKYDAHYAVTSVDPPELIRFIKTYHPDVIFDFPKRYYVDEDGNEREETITMWNLIPRKLMPPTRIARYCCACLKESNGLGRITLTGVRRAESGARSKNRNLAEIGSSKKTRIFLNTDNDASRVEVENCYKKRQTVVNPIINWTNEDVWEFIKKYDIPYCELYNQGYTRLGCIGCPMNSQAAARDFARYPKYKQMYLRAFARMLEEHKKRGMSTDHVIWDTPEDVMAWWLGEDTKRKDDPQIKMFAEMGIEDDDQIEMFEETPEAW